MHLSDRCVNFGYYNPCHSQFRLCYPPLSTSAFDDRSHSDLLISPPAQGQPKAAARLAAVALRETDADPCSSAFAHSNAAVAALERVRQHARVNGSSSTQGEHAEEVEAAGTSLRKVASELGTILGKGHPSALHARENAAAALEPPEGWTFQAHWQPALGAGLGDV